jgi:hypothetical protein
VPKVVSIVGLGPFHRHRHFLDVQGRRVFILADLHRFTAILSTFGEGPSSVDQRQLSEIPTLESKNVEDDEGRWPCPNISS